MTILVNKNKENMEDLNLNFEKMDITPSKIYNTAITNVDNLNDDNTTTKPINIYRYNFEEIFMDQLTAFAKLHQYDDRKVYKESWKLWIEENKDMADKEEIRLNELGYEGDVIDKMYKASRYYFRKKSQVKPEPKKRRKYISMDQELIIIMDQHIIRNMSSNDYTPSGGYSEFCKLHTEFIKSEIMRMIELDINPENISTKFKKTYKNRYFIISRHININECYAISDDNNIININNNINNISTINEQLTIKYET